MYPFVAFLLSNSFTFIFYPFMIFCKWNFSFLIFSISILFHSIYNIFYQLSACIAWIHNIKKIFFFHNFYLHFILHALVLFIIIHLYINIIILHNYVLLISDSFHRSFFSLYFLKSIINFLTPCVLFFLNLILLNNNNLIEAITFY